MRRKFHGGRVSFTLGGKFHGGREVSVGWVDLEVDLADLYKLAFLLIRPPAHPRMRPGDVLRVSAVPGV